MTLEQINQRIQGFTNAIGGLTLSEILRFIEDVRAFIAENPGTAWVDHIGDDSALSVVCYESEVKKYLCAITVNERTMVVINRNGRCYELSEDEVRSLQ